MIPEGKVSGFCATFCGIIMTCIIILIVTFTAIAVVSMCRDIIIAGVATRTQNPAYTLKSVTAVVDKGV